MNWIVIYVYMVLINFENSYGIIINTYHDFEFAGNREPDASPVSTSRRPSMRVPSKPLLSDESSSPDQIIPPEDLMLKRRGSIL